MSFFIPFGDSHTHFWGRQPDFPGVSLDPLVPQLYWLGPAKAYGLSSPTQNFTKEKFLNIKPLLGQPGIIPIACFGEIDIRVNCSRAFLFDGMVDHISSLVKNYLSQLSAMDNKTIIIWGPVPSSLDEKQNLNRDFPAFGDNAVRNYLTHCFNKEILKQISAYPKLKFLTFFYDLINPDLTTKVNVLADGIHLSTSYQPQALNLVKQMLLSDNKVLLNYAAFQAIKPHRRAFKLVSSWDKTPYINFYKKSSGNLVHYFSYVPLIENDELLSCAFLESL